MFCESMVTDSIIFDPQNIIDANVRYGMGELGKDSQAVIAG